MKICPLSFEGHRKDGEAGASGKGEPQTDALSEGLSLGL